MLQGRTVTSWPSLQTDLRNAGATWVDERNVVDGNLITSRNPDDLPAFNSALLEAIQHGVDSAGSAQEIGRALTPYVVVLQVHDLQDHRHCPFRPAAAVMGSRRATGRWDEVS